MTLNFFNKTDRSDRTNKTDRTYKSDKTYKSYRSYRSYRSNRSYFFVLVFLCLVLPVCADDFSRVKEDIIQNAWIKTSLFYLSPGLRLNGMGYSTNIYSYESRESPDWTADLGLELNLAFVFKNRLIIQVKEYPSYSAYAENDRERAFNNIFNVTAFTWAGRFNIKYEFDYPYVRRHLNPETGWLVRQWQSDNTLSVDYGNLDRFFFNFYLSQSTVYFKDELFMNSFNMNELFGRTEYWAGVSVNRTVFTGTRVTFQFEYFDQRFRYVRTRDRTGQQYSVAVRFPVDGRLTGVLRYGLRFIRPSTTLYRDFIAPFGSGTVSIRILRRLRLHAEYSLDNQYSFAGADLYYDTRSVGGGATFFITRNIGLTGIISTGERAYKLLRGGGVVRRDTFDLYTAALTVRPAENTELGVEYRAFRCDSTHLRFLRSYDYIGGYIRYDF